MQIFKYMRCVSLCVKIDWRNSRHLNDHFLKRVSLCAFLLTEIICSYLYFFYVKYRETLKPVWAFVLPLRKKIRSATQSFKKVLGFDRWWTSKSQINHAYLIILEIFIKLKPFFNNRRMFWNIRLGTRKAFLSWQLTVF